MVDTDLLAVYDLSMYAQLPKLQANDVAQAVMYALNTPDHVQVSSYGNSFIILIFSLRFSCYEKTLSENFKIKVSFSLISVHFETCI